MLQLREVSSLNFTGSFANTYMYVDLPCVYIFVAEIICSVLRCLLISEGTSFVHLNHAQCHNHDERRCPHFTANLR